MKNLLVYFGQVILVSGILYGYYYFFLRNKQFHQYNRFYLLAASLLSLLIPLIRIPLSFNNITQQSPAFVRLLEIISVTETNTGITPVEITSTIGTSSFSWQQLIYAAYVLVFILLLIRMLLSLLKIWKMASSYPVEQLNDIRFVKTREPGTPFSFFRIKATRKKLRATF